MNSHAIRLIFYLFIFILGPVSLFAQASDINASINSEINNYFDKVNTQAVIYTGKLQTSYPRFYKNHPYLVTDQYVKGALSYDGIFYPDVAMRIDLFKEELITFSPNNFYSIIVENNKVDSLFLHDKKIIYFDPAKQNESLAPGYYIQLYDGPICSLLKKEKCLMLEKYVDMTIEREFKNDIKYYIKKDGTYYTVKSKGSVLNVLKSHKKELKQFIKHQKLNFKESTDEAIVAVLQQYEKMTQVK